MSGLRGCVWIVLSRASERKVSTDQRKRKYARLSVSTQDCSDHTRRTSAANHKQSIACLQIRRSILRMSGLRGCVWIVLSRASERKVHESEPESDRAGTSGCDHPHEKWVMPDVQQ